MYLDVTQYPDRPTSSYIIWTVVHVLENLDGVKDEWNGLRVVGSVGGLLGLLKIKRF